MKLIKRIEIEGFRSSISVDLKKVSDLNIFAGKNDTGKSNILRALNLFFNHQTSFEENFDFNQDFSKGSLLSAREQKKGKQFISITVHFELDNIKTHSDLIKASKAHHEGLWMKKTWWRFNDIPTEDTPSFLKAERGRGQLKASFSKLIKAINFIYIPAFKGGDVFASVLRMAGDQENALITELDFKGLNSALGKATDDLTQDFHGISEIKSKITLPTTLGTFWHNLEISTAYDQSLIETEIKKGKIEDYNVPLANRGDGIKSLFVPVMLNWLAKKQSKKYWIWGIDEPENSLEMSRTTNLFNEFYANYSKDAQIFCSTHSPAFIFPGEEKNRSIVYLTDFSEKKGSDYQILDFNTENNKAEIEKTFGAERLAFLEIQEDTAKKLREAEENREKAEKIAKEYEKKIKTITTPLVITEGKSDWKHLKKSLTRLKEVNKFKKLNLSFLEFEDDAGETARKQMLDGFAKVEQPKKIIFIFDRDNPNTVKEYDGDATTPYKDWGNNVYSFCIPKPDNRTFDEICIEHYYTDEEIKTVDDNGRRLFLGSEFSKLGPSLDGQFFAAERNKCERNTIIDKYVFLTGDYTNSVALPKDHFAQNVANDKAGFDNFNIDNFELIFEIIKKILGS